MHRVSKFVSMLRLLLCCYLWHLTEPASAIAQAELCGQPPPTIDETTKGDIKGRINALSKLLGSAELGGQVEIVRKQILSQYPKADETVLRLTQLYYACIMIMTDTTLGAKDRIEIFNKVNGIFEISSAPQQQQPENISIIYTTYYSPENSKVIDMLENMDGKTIYIDTINADLAIDENYEILENCWDKMSTTEDRFSNGYLDGVRLPLPVEHDRKNKSCYYSIVLESLDKRQYHLSSGGTGVVNWLIRKTFLVNTAYVGASVTF